MNSINTLHQPRELTVPTYDIQLRELERHGKVTRVDSVNTTTPNHASVIDKIRAFAEITYSKDVGNIVTLSARRVEDGMTFNWSFDRYDNTVNVDTVVTRYTNVIEGMMK